jgi:hypothetical protein
MYTDLIFITIPYYSFLTRIFITNNFTVNSFEHLFDYSIDL